jgi:PAS domain S-box-containing protein
MKNRVGRWSLAAAVFAVLMFCCIAPAQTKSVKRVLILNEVDPSFPAIRAVDEGIQESLRQSPYRIEYYREYLNTNLFPDTADQKDIRTSLTQRYRNRRPDVIITVGSSAIEFMAEAHRQSFPGVPIVFCLSNNAESRIALDDDFASVQGGVSADTTVQAALRLLPGTKQLFVVAGKNAYDREKLITIAQQLAPYQDSLKISYLTELTMPALLERLRHLPNDSIVLLAGLGQDAAGTQFKSSDTGPMVSAASNRPVFTLLDVYLGHGEVGGNLASFKGQALTAGNIVSKILGGAKPRDIPTTSAPHSYMFDWRVLKRWGMNERNLPPGSVVINRPVSAWQAYKWFIVTAIGLMTGQALLIVALLWQKARRRKAELDLRESEERFRRLANTAPVLIWMSGSDKLCSYFNQSWLDFTGRTIEQELGDGWAEGVHPNDRKACLDTYEAAFDHHQSFRVEYRLRRHDGEYRWVDDTGVARFDPDGSFAGYIGSCIDITDRKAAEDRMATIGRRLIEAQEQERTRVARELHDDIVQRLALFQIQLDRFNQNLPRTRPELQFKLDGFCAEIFNITKDVQGISHRLHSSKFEYLGLVGAVRDFCAEFSEQYKVQINVEEQQVPASLENETSLCVFRVLQTALTNAVKHSGVKQFEVLLRGTSNGLQLTVSDEGAGFDPEHVLGSHGIGLVTMRERVRLVHGHISIQSRPSGGTTIHVDVPLSHPETQAQSARIA